MNTANWGNISSIAGLIISLIGFCVTIVNTVRSRKAAEQAEQLTKKMRGELRLVDTVVQCTEAISIMDEIKRLHRGKLWSSLPDRYSTLRRLLTAIRSSTAQLSDEQRAVIQGATVHFGEMERKVEKAILSQGEAPDIIRFNSVVSTQIDKLGEVLIQIQNCVGR